jgi:hypothetical protein
MLAHLCWRILTNLPLLTVLAGPRPHHRPYRRTSALELQAQRGARGDRLTLTDRRKRQPVATVFFSGLKFQGEVR